MINLNRIKLKGKRKGKGIDVETKQSEANILEHNDTSANVATDFVENQNAARCLSVLVPSRVSKFTASAYLAMAAVDY